LLLIDGTLAKINIVMINLLTIFQEEIQEINKITPDPWAFINEIIIFLSNNFIYVITGLIGVLALIKIIMGRL